jgi:hypothetical protein
MSRALTATPLDSTCPSTARGEVRAHAGDAPNWAFVGGALIADLDLRANLTLAYDCADAPAPSWLVTELAGLFETIGKPLDSDWAESMPADAAPLACLAVRVGRALAADPDGLTIDAAAWPGDLIAPETFERAYRARYPWRGLRWLRCGET